jgi:hypothetical protein
MYCQACGAEASTRYVAFYQNIGALVIRFHSSVEGWLCKSCIHKYFWQYTLVNCTLGWWGLISLILTPCFILNNTVRYLLCLGMPPVPAYATPRAQEELSPEEVHRKVEPFLEEICERLNQGAYLDDLAEEYAPRAELPAGWLREYVAAVLRKQRGAE